MAHRALSATLTIALLATFCFPALAAVPGLNDPLLHSVTPWEAQQGQQVLIAGVNFGSAPEVRFKNELATIVSYRPDVGRILVTVPAGDTDGPLIVTNTDIAQASNAADFRPLPGSFVEACSIGGDVTDPSSVALPGAIVVALDPATEAFAGAGVSAAISGSYSIGLAATGNYLLIFIPPQGAPYPQATYLATCGGTRDHQFTTGLELSGRVVSDSPAPIANAWVSVEGTGDFGTDGLSDSNGDFALYVPADDYNIEIVGPVGGRHVAASGGPLAVTVDTDLGDIALDSGVIVSGELRWQDGGDSGPLGGAWVTDYDSDGTTMGITTSIADGSFHLPTETGTGLVLNVAPDVYGFEELAVRSIDVAADMELDYPFTVYSWAGQLPAAPTITETGSMTVQEGQRLQFDAAQLRGTDFALRFSDGLGGWIDGVNTFVAQERGGLVTTVPTGADSGDVVLRVDGVDSPGYPLTVAPALYDPGPFTTSGVIDDGSSAVENAFVGIFEFGCDDEFLVDYDVTGPSGAYSVRHGAGDYAIFVLPPAAAGLARGRLLLPGTTGGQVRNVTLTGGHLVAARCADSGDGPVGSSDALADCEVEFNGADVDHDDSAVSDDDGNMTLILPTGNYEVSLGAPFGSRYISGDGSVLPITGDVDFGDATLDSGYFLEGRIVDPSGDGLIGVEVTAYDTNLGIDAGRTHTVGPDGNFRLAVPPGSHHLFVSVHADHEYWVASRLYVFVDQDVLFYPAMQAEIAGHVTGQVIDSLASPVEELPVAAYHDLLGFVRQTDTCADGTYDLKLPDGNYVIHARPSFDELCMADEYYDGHYDGCGADMVALTAPATVTGIDFTLEPAGSISGSVIGEFGPVADVAVCATDGLLESRLPSRLHDQRSRRHLPADQRARRRGLPCRRHRAGLPVGMLGRLPRLHRLRSGPGRRNASRPPASSSIRGGAAPGPVPDGDHVSGTPMSAATRRGAGEIVIDWQPTCDADDHAIYFGPLRELLQLHLRRLRRRDVGLAGR